MASCSSPVDPGPCSPSSSEPCPPAVFPLRTQGQQEAAPPQSPVCRAPRPFSLRGGRHRTEESGRQSHQECSGRTARDRGRHCPSSQRRWPGCVSWVGGWRGASQRQLWGQLGRRLPRPPWAGPRCPTSLGSPAVGPAEKTPLRLGFCSSGLPEAGPCLSHQGGIRVGPRPPTVLTPETLPSPCCSNTSGP